MARFGFTVHGITFRVTAAAPVARGGGHRRAQVLGLVRAPTGERSRHAFGRRSRLFAGLDDALGQDRAFADLQSGQFPEAGDGAPQEDAHAIGDIGALERGGHAADQDVAAHGTPPRSITTTGEPIDLAQLPIDGLHAGRDPP